MRSKSCVHFAGKQLLGEGVHELSAEDTIGRGLAYWKSCTEDAVGKRLNTSMLANVLEELSPPDDNVCCKGRRRDGQIRVDDVIELR